LRNRLDIDIPPHGKRTEKSSGRVLHARAHPKTRLRAIRKDAIVIALAAGDGGENRLDLRAGGLTSTGSVRAAGLRGSGRRDWCRFPMARVGSGRDGKGYDGPAEMASSEEPGRTLGAFNAVGISRHFPRMSPIRIARERFPRPGASRSAAQCSPAARQHQTWDTP
jgi:hypothetical protein